jgi:ubiquinone/menaquinone biosynthesis C-methylase UbiE
MKDYKKKTIEYYNNKSEEMSEKFRDLMDIKKRYEFDKFINLLKGKKVLDLGSGSGEHAEYFSDRGFDVLCVDLAENMVRLCKEKGLKAEVMDIENLKFEDNAFDGIWAVTSLIFTPKSKIQKVIKDLHRILKKDGIIYVCVKEGEGEKWVKKKGENEERYFVFWKEEELKKEFEKYFELIESKRARRLDTNIMLLNVFFRKTD